MIKGIKPRTHLILDLIQFVLISVLALTALIQHTTPSGRLHFRFMFHALHEVAGILLLLAVGLHLFLHLPWIEAQLKRLIQSRA